MFILTKHFQHIEGQLDNKMETISFRMALKRDKHEEEAKVKIKKKNLKKEFIFFRKLIQFFFQRKFIGTEAVWLFYQFMNHEMKCSKWIHWK